MIAAERTGRRYYGIELDPAYVDTIVRRWQALTGGSARHAVSGRGFATSRAGRRPPMPSDKKRDYAVGFGIPPRHTHFEKGRSGNPKGRPSSTGSLSTLFIEALNETVSIPENGGRRKISKRQPSSSG